MAKVGRYCLIVVVLTIVGIIAAHPTILRTVAASALRSADFELLELGNLEVDWGATTTIHAERVIVSHPDALLELGNLQIALATRSLWSNSGIQIDEIHLQNWQVTINTTSEPGQSPETDEDNLLPLLESLLIDFSHPLLAVTRVQLQQGVLFYSDEDQQIDLKVADFKGQSQGKRFDISLNGILNTAPVQFSAYLRREGEFTELLGTGNWQAHELKLSTRVKQVRPLTELTTEFSLTAPQAKPMLRLLGAPEVRDGALQIRANLSGDNNYLNTRSVVQIGELNLSSNLGFNLQNQNFELEFNGSGPSLKEAGALVDYVEYLNEPFSFGGNLKRDENGLNLRRARFQLGPGFFNITGTLPEFPDVDNWQLELTGERFDISFFQPFVPCRLPELDLDWRGKLATDALGQETAELNVTDGYGQRIMSTATLGPYPDLSGTRLAFKLENMSSAFLTSCLGLGLETEKQRSLNGEIVVTRSPDTWRLEQLAIDAEIATITAKTTSANQTEISLLAPDIKLLAELLPELPTRLKPNSLELTANLSLAPLKLEATTFSIGESGGSIKLSTNRDNRTSIYIDLAGPDLKLLLTEDVFRDRSGEMPYSASIEATLYQSLIDTSAAFVFTENELFVETQINLADPGKSPTLNVEGHGSNLATMLSPFVHHELPEIPYSLTFSLSQSETLTRIEQFRLEAGQHTLVGNLNLDKPPNLERTTGTLKLRSTSSNELLKLIGYQTDMADVAVKFDIELEGDQDAVQVALKNGLAGDTSLAGDITVKPGPNPEIAVDLVSDHVHMPTFIPSLETSTDEVKEAVKPKQKVIPELDLPWHLIANTTLDFNWLGKKITLKEGQTSSAQVAFTIFDGRLTSEAINWQSELNNGQISLLLDTRNQPAGFGQFRFELQSDRIPAIWLFTGLPDQDDPGNLNFHARLNGFGRSTTELLANLDGEILFRGGSGRINAANLDTLFGDFLFQITNRVFGTGAQQTKISCTGGGFYIRSGELRMDPGLAVRTSRFDMLASGQINLATEKLNLTLSSRSRQGIGVSATALVPRVGISGTLGKPQIDLNARDTALAGGAAIASSGLSVLATGLWDRLRTSVVNPCDSLVERARSDGLEYYKGLN